MNQLRRYFFPALFILLTLTVFQAAANDRDHDFRDREHDSRSWRDHDFDHHRDFGRDRDNDRSRSSGQEGARVPLDGGISLLVAAGIGLGMKKAADKKNAAKTKDSDIAE